MKRLAPSEYQYKNMSEIIDACMVSGPGISSYDMCIGDFQFLLHKLRIVTYGNDYKISVKCPRCGYTEDININLDDMSIIEYSDEIEKLAEFELPVSKKIVRIKNQTPRLVDNVFLKEKEYKKRLKDRDEKLFDFKLLYTLVGIIETVDGVPYDSFRMEDFCKNLSMKDVNTIYAHINKMNESVGINSEVSCECDLCGHEYVFPFRAKSDFFSPAVDL